MMVLQFRARAEGLTEQTRVPGVAHGGFTGTTGFEDLLSFQMHN